MPEALEAGTANAHGLAGLAAGCNWLADQGVANVSERIAAMANRFANEISAVGGVRLLGGGSGQRCGIVALNLGDVDSGVVSDALSQHYGICTRPGAHCAPLMHKALGTETQGVVRFSFGAMNDDADVDAAIAATKELASEFSGE